MIVGHLVKVARRFLAAKQQGTEPEWPISNLYLWIRLWENLADLDCNKSAITWVEAHVDPRAARGVRKVHAFFNGVVDSVAKHTVHSFRLISPVYQQLIADHVRRQSQARRLSRYHSLVAMYFANQTSEEPLCVVDFAFPEFLGPGFTFDTCDADQVWCVHRVFFGYAMCLVPRFEVV